MCTMFSSVKWLPQCGSSCGVSLQTYPHRVSADMLYKYSRTAYKRWPCVTEIGQVANSSLYRKIQSITKLPQTLTLTQSSALWKCFLEFSAGVPLVRGITSCRIESFFCQSYISFRPLCLVCLVVGIMHKAIFVIHETGHLVAPRR